MALNTETLQAQLPEFLISSGHYINGSFQRNNGQRSPVIDPATRQQITDVQDGTTEDADAAIAAAREAFDFGPWPKMSGRERSRILLRVASLMEERADELASIESLDVGKPLGMARQVDVDTAAGHFEYAAALAQQLDGAVRPTPLPTHAFTVKEPIGVVAAITPFNFPLILSSTKIAMALAAGNTVVHKPAPDTPLTALYMAKLLTEAGVPDGVVNVVTGTSPTLGSHLVSHPQVNMIAFTGSTTVGAKVTESAGAHLKPVAAELGGNGANLVFADADLDCAVETIIGSFTFNAGQFCMAGARLLVERPVYQELLDRLQIAVGEMSVGAPTDPTTMMGPLASQQQLDKVSSMVQRAVEAGARIVTGGAAMADSEGFYYAPTVITNVADDDEIVRDEVFGPVLTIQVFDTEEEAISRANATPYGLAAGVQTSDVSRIHRVTSQLQAGMVWANSWGMLDPAVPFGGMKDSGWGREGGPEAIASYQQTKSIVIGIEG